MKALDRKVFRDLRLLWSQAVTIALVVGSGIGGFVGCLSAVESLSVARERFYEAGRFADVFATVKRAPLVQARRAGRAARRGRRSDQPSRRGRGSRCRTAPTR